MMRTVFFTIAAALSAAGFGYAADLANIPDQKFEAREKYLLLPMKASAKDTEVTLLSPDGAVLAQFQGSLADKDPDWYADVDISAYKGRILDLRYDRQNVKDLAHFQSAEPEKNAPEDEYGRPGFHLTSNGGAMGQFNGLFYFKGKWRAFYQLYPFAADGKYGSYEWGYAEGGNLLIWRNLPAVMRPRFFGEKIEKFLSGGAYVDVDNKSGMFAASGGGVIFSASTNLRPCVLIFSSDLKTFTEASFAPDIKGDGRNPRIFYNRDYGLWTIVRAEKTARDSDSYAAVIYVSKDLSRWEKTAVVAGLEGDAFSLVKVPPSGAPTSAKWALLDSTGGYVIGDFNGRKFVPASKKQRIFFGSVGDVSVWGNTPSGNVLVSALIRQPEGLMRKLGQRYTDCMGVPWELRLVQVKGGAFQLRAYIPHEIETHIGEGVEALETGQMEFSGNIFEIPGAGGNRFLIGGRFFTSNAANIIIEVGLESFDYNFGSNSFTITRAGSQKYSLPAQVPLNRNIIDYRMFVDTCAVELQMGAGEAVLVWGDALLEDLQQIRIGSGADVYTDFMGKFPIFKKPVSEIKAAGAKRFEKVLKELGLDKNK